MKDEWDEFAYNLSKFINMDGRKIDSSNNNILFNRSQKISPTKEEAITQARADAMKKGQPFKESEGTDIEEANEDAVNKYIDDMLDRFI